MESPSTSTQELLIDSLRPHLHISLLANPQRSDETRFLLTPEACGRLTAIGVDILMEKNAAVDINFTDEAYETYGVKIVDRKTALKQQVVLSYGLPSEADVRHMQTGSMLLSMNDDDILQHRLLKTLIERHITTGILEIMYSHNEEYVFANLIDEIDGRTAIMYAVDALSFLGGGKGVLLGGVPGIPPTEVLIIGAGQKVYSAARAAMNIGAAVCLMDNDISALQTAQSYCGYNLVTSAIHPRVLINHARTADVLILDACTRDFELPAQVKAVMKESLFTLDFTRTEPSICVPRTVAMALSNVLVNFLEEMFLKNGPYGMLATTQGMQAGVITYNGHLTNQLLGSLTGLPSTDINLLLTGTN